MKKTLSYLTGHFSYLASQREMASARYKTKSTTDDKGELAGEYQQIMDQEYFDFVLFEMPWSAY
jgi:V-type H+-transporting ATPase subunit C